MRSGRRAVWALLAAIVIAGAIAVLWLLQSTAFWQELGAALDTDDLETAMGLANAGTALAYAMMVPLGVTVAVWVGLYYLFLRDLEPPRGGLYLVFMLLAVAVVGAGAAVALRPLAIAAAATQRAPFHGAIAEMRRALDVAAEPTAGPLDRSAKTQGDAGILETSFKAKLTGVRLASGAYRDALAMLDYPASLTPARLATGDLGALKTKLVKADSAMWGYREYLEWIARRGEELIASLSVPDNTKAALTTDFYAEVGRDIAQREAVLEMDEHLNAQLQALVALLAQSKGRWSVSGNAIRFRDPAEQEAYDNDVAALRALERERANVLESAGQIAGFREP